ncbi:MAG: DUF6089 family protein [Bacteroidaceae bacterium]|nr:DUF6089 family protein [Bacteroidaceae bacterium]
MKRSLLLLTTCLLALNASAQQGDILEYQQEVGGGVGLMSYMGDAGGGFLTKPGLMGALLWRRNLNPRMVIKTDAAFGHISGTTEGRFIPANALSHTAAGGAAAPVIHFGRNVLDVGAQFEFNFLGYGLGPSYKGLSRWTPYLLAGAGLTICMGGGADAVGTMNLPMGVGFRYKLKPRLNLGIEWSVRFTDTDRLDDSAQPTKLNDPLGIESDFFKNKDCYQMLLVSLTYDIAPKYRKCNN